MKLRIERDDGPALRDAAFKSAVEYGEVHHEQQLNHQVFFARGFP